MPLDVLAECAEASGWSRSRAQELQALPTTEAALHRLVAAGVEGQAVLNEAARRVVAVVKREFGITAEVLLTDSHGTVIGKN
jgi:cobalamin biosynthesis protein CbiD